MAVSWIYYFQYASATLFGADISRQPLQVIILVSLLIAGAFLIGIIYELNKNYKKSESIESLLFLIGMITLIPALIFGIVSGLCYSLLGLPDLGIMLQIIGMFPIQFTYMCVNLFAIRMTFPKRYKLVLVILLLLSAGTIGAQLWAIAQGPPHFDIINFGVIYSPEVQIVRFTTLIIIAAIPISVFYYYAAKVREENRPRSNLSIWLGTGILCFVIAFQITTIITLFRIMQLFYIPASIIFYVCFAMPEWFKNRIGWTE
ncbi:MAG: hypothetical protein ACFFCM_08140 [Promethearchaeota archaeon]